MAVISRRERRNADAEAESNRTGTRRVPRTRVAAARGAWAVGSVFTLIARLVRLAAAIVFLIIAVAIVLRVAGANPGNVVVRDFHDVANTLVGPFRNIFSLKNPKATLALNWGIAAVVYAIVGSLVASLIARVAPRGVHPARPVA
jgi:uncharacterized protein YggT (Ycf19 family)